MGSGRLPNIQDYIIYIQYSDHKNRSLLLRLFFEYSNLFSFFFQYFCLLLYPPRQTCRLTSLDRSISLRSYIILFADGHRWRRKNRKVSNWRVCGPSAPCACNPSRGEWVVGFQRKHQVLYYRVSDDVIFKTSVITQTRTYIHTTSLLSFTIPTRLFSTGIIPMLLYVNLFLTLKEKK